MIEFNNLWTLKTFEKLLFNKAFSNCSNIQQLLLLLRKTLKQPNKPHHSQLLITKISSQSTLTHNIRPKADKTTLFISPFPQRKQPKTYSAPPLLLQLLPFIHHINNHNTAPATAPVPSQHYHIFPVFNTTATTAINSVKFITTF